MSELPTTAKAVIIGGGIIGCSTAYHLGKLGWTDTVLLEKHKLTSGSTFHAAGLVGQLRTSANITQLLGNSVALYKELEAETGLATGWKMNGGLRLACNEARWTEVKRQATTAHSFGLEMNLLTPSEAKELWPLMQVDDVVGAAFLPTDGQANPSDITQAMAKGARNSGVTIKEDVTVQSVDVRDGKIHGVQTDQGYIECEIVVCCAGQWSRELSSTVGVNVPLVSVQHQYIVTEKIEGVETTMPTLRDPDRLIYFKEEVGGLVMGGYEPNPIPWAEEGIPDGFNYTLLDNDLEHFEQLMELALGRCPALEHAGVKQMINGPESFTPDGNFILGQAPELKNYFVGAGFNAFGIASGGGAGQALAEWVVKGEAPYDLWSVDIRRFGRPHFDTDWVRTRTLEAYGKHYTIAWPSEEHDSGRPCRRSPLYDRLAVGGACFGEKLGWERPNWYADLSAGEEPKDVYSMERPNWFGPVGREHRAVRETAGLFDQSSFAKFVVQGPDAASALEWICANRIDKPVGSLTYTQMLNDEGGIECDVTVVRTHHDRFYIVTGTGFATHDLDWIKRQIPEDARAEAVDVTSAYAVLSLFGPNARDILGAVTRDDISNEGFKFATAKEIGIKGCPALALRVTYVGELGWELHIPTEYAIAVYDALMKAGESHGLHLAGYRVIETLRLEKAYRAWGSDIGPDHTPVEAGLAWAVKTKSNIDFKGRAAIEEQLAKGVAKRLAGFTVEDPNITLLGRETIYRNGERVGWLTSAGFGHTVGKPIGYGYVRNREGVDEDYLTSGAYELDVAMQRIPATLHLQPLYDPKNEKIKS